ncbi:hypothetical protein BGW36DRAFT_365363 [Talaromyces proteolyticus]|uniref:SnoaL-like domain-containing protein n=1 Tax=Talaromyces proteolyticus TaxID=1131652 RepID=A0AAD4PRS1_9EURO|nr:uncharacterized protein BGW36DRAFT_365363 [Talaromyces proteolyticus]KAH8689594.1 hypothetical protein BGW36DRAFT_365363 [Talaromyces proteolyticus]
MAVSQEASDIIQRKKLQYCRYIDTNQLQQLDTVIIPDAKLLFLQSDGSVMNAGGTDFSFSSRQEFVSYYGSAFEGQQTMHHIGAGDFEQLSLNEIKAIWGVIYYSSTKEAVGGLMASGGGYYYETWTRKDGDWFMSKMRFERAFWKITRSE